MAEPGRLTGLGNVTTAVSTADPTPGLGAAAGLVRMDAYCPRASHSWGSSSSSPFRRSSRSRSLATSCSRRRMARTGRAISAPTVRTVSSYRPHLEAVGVRRKASTPRCTQSRASMSLIGTRPIRLTSTTAQSIRIGPTTTDLAVEAAASQACHPDGLLPHSLPIA